MKTYEELTEEQKAKAKSLGYVGMFANKDTLQEAYDHAMSITASLSPGDRTAATLAIHILMNTYAIHMAQEIL